MSYASTEYDPKFANGKIYKLTSPHTSQIYIASTILKLPKRLSLHRSQHARASEGLVRPDGSKFLFDLGDVYIELIEDYPCNSRAELLAREQYHITENAGLIVDQISAMRAKDVVCECGAIVTNNNLINHMTAKKCCAARGVAYDPAQDIRKVRDANHSAEQKAKVKAYRAAKVVCGCGSTYCKSGKAVHEKTKRHLTWVAAQA